MAIERLELGAVVYTIDHAAQRVESVWPSGETLAGCPEDTDAYRHRAAQRGYSGADPTWHMCRVHDLLHHLVFQLLGWQWSPTLYLEATGHRFALAGDEESLIRKTELYVNGVTEEPPRDYCEGLLSGKPPTDEDWRLLRERVRNLFRER